MQDRTRAVVVVLASLAFALLDAPPLCAMSPPGHSRRSEIAAPPSRRSRWAPLAPPPPPLVAEIRLVACLMACVPANLYRSQVAVTRSRGHTPETTIDERYDDGVLGAFGQPPRWKIGVH